MGIQNAPSDLALGDIEKTVKVTQIPIAYIS